MRILRELCFPNTILFIIVSVISISSLILLSTQRGRSVDLSHGNVVDVHKRGPTLPSWADSIRRSRLAHVDSPTRSNQLLILLQNFRAFLISQDSSHTEATSILSFRLKEQFRAFQSTLISSSALATRNFAFRFFKDLTVRRSPPRSENDISNLQQIFVPPSSLPSHTFPYEPHPPRLSGIFSSLTRQNLNENRCFYFGKGNVPGFTSVNQAWILGTNLSTFSVSKTDFPDLPRQYLSQMYGRGNKAWSVSIPVPKNETFRLVLGFAEIFDLACQSGRNSKFRVFRVTAGESSQLVDVMAAVGCGQPYELVIDQLTTPGRLLTILLEGVNRTAILSTACVGLSKTPTASLRISTNSPVVSAGRGMESVSPVPSRMDDDLILPNSSYTCVNFGPSKVKNYLQYRKSAVRGYTKGLNLAMRKNMAGIPTGYQSSLEGNNWKYRLLLPKASKYRVVTGFIESYWKVCRNRNSAEETKRVFSVKVGKQLQTVDVFNSAGCYAPYQLVYEKIPSKKRFIDISLKASFGKAMLSVLCYSELSNNPLPSISENTTVTPILPSASGQSIPTSSNTPGSSIEPSGFYCFKFDGPDVNGFSEVIHSTMDEELWYYSDTAVKIIPSSSASVVYQSHLFGPEFNIVVESNSKRPKAIVFGFAEIFKEYCKKGGRVFKVRIGSISRIVDVFDEAGCRTAFNVRFNGVKPDAGQITIAFSAYKGNAMISGLCLQDLSGWHKISQYEVSQFPNPVIIDEPPFVVKVMSAFNESSTQSMEPSVFSTPSADPSTTSNPSKPVAQSPEPSRKPESSKTAHPLSSVSASLSFDPDNEPFVSTSVLPSSTPEASVLSEPSISETAPSKTETQSEPSSSKIFQSPIASSTATASVTPISEQSPSSSVLASSPKSTLTYLPTMPSSSYNTQASTSPSYFLIPSASISYSISISPSTSITSSMSASPSSFVTPSISVSTSTSVSPSFSMSSSASTSMSAVPSQSSSTSPSIFLSPSVSTSSSNSLYPSTSKSFPSMSTSPSITLYPSTSESSSFSVIPITRSPSASVSLSVSASAAPLWSTSTSPDFSQLPTLSATLTPFYESYSPSESQLADGTEAQESPSESDSVGNSIGENPGDPSMEPEHSSGSSPVIGATFVPSPSLEDDPFENPEASGPIIIDDPPEAPLAVSGEWRDIMGTSPAGRAFPVIMGILGTILVIILLSCIFLAIFRDGPVSYTYSSQYTSPDEGYGSAGSDRGLGAENARIADTGTKSMVTGRLPSGANHGLKESARMIAPAQSSEHSAVGRERNADGSIPITNPFAEYSGDAGQDGPQGLGAMTGYETISNDDAHGYANGGDAPHSIPQNQIDNGDNDGYGDNNGYASAYQYLKDTRYESFMPITENITGRLTQTEAISHVDDHIGFTGAYCANDVDKALSEEILEEEKLRTRSRSEEVLAVNQWRIEESLHQSLHVNPNNVGDEQHGNDGFEENSFDNIGGRIAQSNGSRDLNTCGLLETEGAGSNFLSDAYCNINSHLNSGMYSSNGSNPAPTPYEQDIVLTRATENERSQEMNQGGNSAGGSRQFINNRQVDGTRERESRSRASTEEPWPSWWSRGKVGGAVSSGEFRNNMINEHDMEGFPEECGDVIERERDEDNMKENSSANSNSVLVDTQGPNDNWVESTDENGFDNGIWKGREGLTATGRLLNDHEWRRDSDHENTPTIARELDPEYEYLRRRREPYVKVVANRLSSGVPNDGLDIDQEEWTR